MPNHCVLYLCIGVLQVRHYNIYTKYIFSYFAKVKDFRKWPAHVRAQVMTFLGLLCNYRHEIYIFRRNSRFLSRSCFGRSFGGDLLKTELRQMAKMPASAAEALGQP
jgi:hypothetical protein